MATALKTPRRKALRGIIRGIENNCSVSFINAQVEDQDTIITSEIPKQELGRLNLKIGDVVDIFPIDIDTYFIIGKP